MPDFQLFCESGNTSVPEAAVKYDLLAYFVEIDLDPIRIQE